jgi:DNA polymerase I-like protein with 3'-5' exonuclease and polymerase domains
MSLRDYYNERMKLLPCVSEMQRRGVTVSSSRLRGLKAEFSEESFRNEQICVNLAADTGYDLTLPRSGSNTSLKEFCFGRLKLPITDRSHKTGEPSMDKAWLDHCCEVLPSGSVELAFVRSLRAKRKRDTAIGYLDSYEKFMLPYKGDTYILHPSVNVTGTDTLRTSCSSPNTQQVGKPLAMRAAKRQ